MNPDIAITILFGFEVALVVLGGGYLIRYEIRRDHPVQEPSRTDAIRTSRTVGS